MKLTPEDAHRVVEHGKAYVSNQRHYVRYGGVSYPAASLVWCVHTGQWPEKTPRHLDGNPANNDFSNLRPPGRAKKPREPAKDVHSTDALVPKTAIPVMEENQHLTATAAPTLTVPQSLFP